MIKFYTNQELSHKLGINLARWKRWSREFLPPDPLGGLQSGYARQYNSDQAFTVYLGGYLVGGLKFTIPEARLILHDLRHWMVEHKFYFDYAASAPGAAENNFSIKYFQIAICRTLENNSSDSGFFYYIKGVIANDLLNTNGNSGRQERFIESSVDSGRKSVPLNLVAGYRVLNISIIRDKFLNSLKGLSADT